MTSTEEQFYKHFSALRELVEKNCFLSNLSYIWKSPEYKEIVRLAREEDPPATIIKILFQDLIKERSWETLILLLEILRHDPSPEIRGNLPKMTADLILLGKNSGHIA